MSFDFSSLQTEFSQALAHAEQDIASLRTGKASVQLLDPVKVEAYGTYMQLNEVAQVSAPDANLLVVTPWDKSLMGNVEKAIASAGLNLNPVVDQGIIRIVVPSLTAERRQEMIKLLHQKIESGRVVIRTIRTEGRKHIEAQKGEADVSEDDIRVDEQKLDKLTQDALTKLEQLQQAKEKDLLTI